MVTKVAKSSWSEENNPFCDCIVPKEEKLEDYFNFISKLDKALKVTKRG